VNEWTAELEEIAPFFTRQAIQIANYDKKLVESSDKIFELDHQVREVAASQDKLEHSLDIILFEQTQLNSVLKSIEDEITGASHEPTTDADTERDKGYRMADEINGTLDRMSTNLKDLIGKVNASQRNSADKNNPMNDIVKILNTHMNSLDWIDKQCADLNQKVRELKNVQGEQEAQQARLMRRRFEYS